MKKLLLTFSFSMLFVLAVLAQNITINGRVLSDEDQSPLQGVSIKLKGNSRIGVASKADGTFTIQIRPSTTQVLIFSAVGYLTKEVKAENNMQVSLKPDANSLDEVVVTSYGTVKKKAFAGSASVVDGSVIKDRPVQSFAQGLTGQATGVNIIQPNGVLNNPPVIRVRGLSSLSLSSFPLVVLDGIPISTADASVNSAPNNPLGDINPADIETIDILKDAASTAIYGSRGAAGVLLITTKKGRQGSSQVTFDAWAGFSNAVRLPEVLNGQQYIDHKNRAVANLLAINPNGITAAQQTNGVSFFQNLDANGKPISTNWYDYIYRTGVSQNYNVNLSGANDKSTYFLSGGYSDQNGFIQANTFKRFSGRANFTHQATKWMKLNLNMAYTNSINASPNSGSVAGAAFNTSGLARVAIALPTNIAPYNNDGTLNIDPSSGAAGSGNNKIVTGWPNPLAIIQKDKNSSENNRFIANVGSDISFTKELSFKTNFSWDRSNTENIQFWNPLSGDGFSTTGYAYNNTNRRNNWNWINTLSYNKTFSDVHNLNLIVGSDVQKTNISDWGAQRQNIADPFFGQFQGPFLINNAAGNGISQIAFESYLAIMNYNYDGKYFLSGNFRRDGNSALSPTKRWGNFGGASVAWQISNEEFYKNSDLSTVLNSIKLRGSYGIVGNGSVAAYSSFFTYSPSYYGETGSGFIFNRVGNPNLTWETSKQTDIGLELGFLNRRITVEVDYYHKNIDGMILAVPQAPSKGIPGNTILANVGAMYNKGIELAVNASVFNSEKFSWNANLNFTTVTNKVTALDPSVPQLLTSTSNLEQTNITKVGYPASSIFGVKTNGINDANGRRIFVLLDGTQVQYEHLGSRYTYLDGTTKAGLTAANQQQILGNTIPTWFGGFNNSFRYMNFDLALNFTYSGGNYIYNGTKAGLRDQRVWNNSTAVLSAWSAPGQGATIPKPIFGDNVSNGSSFLISENVEKGDFLRLQTATLGYKLPATLFGKTGIKSLRVYTQVNNAFLITKYSGSDPEISSNGNSNLSSGIERNSVPQARTFTFGLSLGL